MVIDWAVAAGMALAGVLAALGGLFAVAALQPKRAPALRSIFGETQPGTSFVFDGETLIDATPGARTLLSLGQSAGGPWAQLQAYLASHFPGIEERLAALPSLGQLTLASRDREARPLMLSAEFHGGLTRITLLDPEREATAPGVDPLTHRAMGDELEQLRCAVGEAPILMWREGPGGEVTWANAAYLAKAAEKLEPGEDLTWPLPRLFERTATTQGATGQRQRLELPGRSHWFEIVGSADGDGRLLYGLPADAVTQAEVSLRDFMQTLTKTFAHLPIGLAIFDRQRQLALFNPALLDLCGLQPDFLSMKPTLFAFLDAMRDHNMIPEPKDYRSWRKQMTDLEQAASSGLYEETWTLPSGQTYRVLGRPHPNGALALMFEDISTEMSRTRRYRADLELGQSVIDAMEEAIAVFSQTGLLVMSNAAYARLWGHDPATTLQDIGIAAMSAHWRDHSAPTPIWTEAETFVATLGERAPWGGEVRLSDGRLVECRFKPVQGGATLATFRLVPPAGAFDPVFGAGQRKTA